jgi:hypothetical protein
MLDYSVIVSKKSSGNKLKVLAPNGKMGVAIPSRRTRSGQAGVRAHIFKAKQAVGIDESVWQQCKEHIDTVRFVWWDGRVFEMPAKEFERKSFLHGDDITFARTRFVPISKSSSSCRSARPRGGSSRCSRGWEYDRSRSSSPSRSRS